MTFLVFDIETIPDASLPPPKKPDEFPPPPHHEIVTIGAMVVGDNYHPQMLGVIQGATERDKIERFIDFASRGTLVSWNGRAFDCPVVATRALKYGLKMQNWYSSRDTRYRFSDTGHFDLKDYLGDFGAARLAGLDVCARLIGFPGKVGVDGSNVADMVSTGRQSEVDAYCLCDVVQTTALFLRTQWMRGLIRDFDSVSRAFLSFIDSESRVAQVASLINREVFCRVGSI